jgi:hypothetical protein
LGSSQFQLTFGSVSQSTWALQAAMVAGPTAEAQTDTAAVQMAWQTFLIAFAFTGCAQ